MILFSFSLISNYIYIYKKSYFSSSQDYFLSFSIISPLYLLWLFLIYLSTSISVVRLPTRQSGSSSQVVCFVSEQLICFSIFASLILKSFSTASLFWFPCCSLLIFTFLIPCNALSSSLFPKFLVFTCIFFYLI